MKRFKNFFLLLCFSISLSLTTSCNNEIPLTTETDQKDPKIVITKTINELYASKLDISEDLVKSQLAKNLNNDAILKDPSISSEIKQVTQNAIDLVEELRNVDPQQSNTKEEYIESLTQILNHKKHSITNEEFEQIKSSIFITSHIMDLYLHEKGLTKGWWDSWGKCAAGIAGGAIGGGLGGGAAGSVIPVLGTTAGAIVGAIGGGLTGAAAAC